MRKILAQLLTMSRGFRVQGAWASCPHGCKRDACAPRGLLPNVNSHTMSLFLFPKQSALLLFRFAYGFAQTGQVAIEATRCGV